MQATLIQAHGLYSALGQDEERRQAAYRELFRHELEPGLMDQIRRATNGNFVLGDERFAREIEAVIGRRAVPGKSGRPRKRAEPESTEPYLMGDTRVNVNL
jgi:putative transposase